MSVEATDYIISAESHCLGDSEIDWRNAISRAYYGAFHWAQLNVDRCQALPYSASPGGSHEQVINRYKHHGEIAAKAISYILVRMKNQRKIADYQLHSDILHAEAETQVAAARQTVERICTLFAIDCPSFVTDQDDEACRVDATS